MSEKQVFFSAVEPNPRILFVDDEPGVLEGISRAISIDSEDAWDIEFASNGIEALAKMEANPANVVVTDIAMPYMNGKELIEKLGERYPRTVTVVLSGHWSESSALSLLSPNVRFLSKPVGRELLVWTLRQSIKQAASSFQDLRPSDGAPALLGNFSPEVFDLRQLVGTESSSVGDRARGKGLSLSIEFDPGLPYLVRGYPQLVRGCLLRYLHNALESTDRGSICLRVKRVWDCPDSVPVLFEVEDSGAGLSYQAKGKLLAEFRQASTAFPGEPEPGLSDTRRMAIAMGGEAGFDSRHGEGSVFWFVAMMTPTG